MNNPIVHRGPWKMTDIRAAHRLAGGYFFTPAAMRFFDSRILSKVYQGSGGVYFITSEQFHSSSGYSAPRKFTVRVFYPDKADIDTVGEFNNMDLDEARKLALDLSRGHVTKEQFMDNSPGQVEDAIETALRKGWGQRGPWAVEAHTEPDGKHIVLIHYGTPILKLDLQSKKYEVGKGAWGSVSDQTGIRKTLHYFGVLGGVSRREIRERARTAEVEGEHYNPLAAHQGKWIAYCERCGETQKMTKAGYLDCPSGHARRGMSRKTTWRRLWKEEDRRAGNPASRMNVHPSYKLLRSEALPEGTAFIYKAPDGHPYLEIKRRGRVIYASGFTDMKGVQAVIDRFISKRFNPGEPMFRVFTGREPYKVIDLDTGGEAFFDEKVDAYKHMAWIRSLGHNYRLEVRPGTRWTLPGRPSNPCGSRATPRRGGSRRVRPLTNAGKSKCQCGHTGDGPGSQHEDVLGGLSRGHGPCKLCPCPKFTWAGFLSGYQRPFAKSNPYLVRGWLYPGAKREDRFYKTFQGAKKHADWLSRVAGYPKPPIYEVSAKHTGDIPGYRRKQGRPNPSGTLKIGRQLVRIVTTKGSVAPRGACPVYGLKSGSIACYGKFTKLPRGTVKYVEYMDEAKARRCGMNDPSLPWRHDFTKEHPILVPTKGGLVIEPAEGHRLWEVRS